MDYPKFCCGAHITRVIFDGRPWDVARCAKCGEVITATDVLTDETTVSDCGCLSDSFRDDPEELW